MRLLNPFHPLRGLWAHLLRHLLRLGRPQAQVTALASSVTVASAATAFSRAFVSRSLLLPAVVASSAAAPTPQPTAVASAAAAAAVAAATMTRHRHLPPPRVPPAASLRLVFPFVHVHVVCGGSP